MTIEAVVDGTKELDYERAFELYWGDVFRFALAWTNDWAAAEDLAQESFLRLWQQAASFDWSRPILPWLLVAARRLATDRFRALRRRVLPHPTGSNVAESVQARWLDVQAAMESLSSLERTAIVLTAIDGWSYAEAAGLLGTTDGALRAAVSRARAKLEVAS